MTDYELYHTGVRKHKYIKKIGNRYFYTQDEIKAYLDGKKPKNDVTFEKNTIETRDGKMKDYRIDFNKHDGGHKKGGWSDGVGVRVGNKKVQVYNTTNKKYWKNDEEYIEKKRGRLTSSYAEDGSEHTLDLSKKKRKKKNAKSVASKVSKKTMSAMKKQAARGKKAIDKYYTKMTTPDITVTYDEAKLK